MLGISDFSAFCAAILLFLALRAFARAASAKVRAHPRVALERENTAGLFGVAFGVKREAA